jgi:hypothetical protein
MSELCDSILPAYPVDVLTCLACPCGGMRAEGEGQQSQRFRWQRHISCSSSIKLTHEYMFMDYYNYNGRSKLDW